MNLWEFDGHSPKLPEDGSAWIAPGAQLIGAVHLGSETSIWFNTVLRADNDEIAIGAGSNVQDGAVLHVDPGFPVRIGAGVTIGHKALIHGCTIGDHSLIGMGAVVMNGARIGEESLVGAGALIPEGREIPPRSLVLGQPGKVIRTLDEDALAMLRGAAEHYRRKAEAYRNRLRRVG